MSAICETEGTLVPDSNEFDEVNVGEEKDSELSLEDVNISLDDLDSLLDDTN